MKKKNKFFHINPNALSKTELNASRIHSNSSNSNNSSIMNTQNSLSKIIKTDEDNLFNSNRNRTLVIEKDIDDIERKLASTGNSNSNKSNSHLHSNNNEKGTLIPHPSKEPILPSYRRQNIISNRDVTFPTKLIQPTIELHSITNDTTTTATTKEKDNEVKQGPDSADTNKTANDNESSNKLTFTDKKILCIGFGLLFIIALIALVFIFIKVIK